MPERPPRRACQRARTGQKGSELRLRAHTTSPTMKCPKGTCGRFKRGIARPWSKADARDEDCLTANATCEASNSDSRPQQNSGCLVLAAPTELR